MVRRRVVLNARCANVVRTLVVRCARGAGVVRRRVVLMARCAVGDRVLRVIRPNARRASGDSVLRVIPINARCAGVILCGRWLQPNARCAVWFCAGVVGVLLAASERRRPARRTSRCSRPLRAQDRSFFNTLFAMRLRR